MTKANVKMGISADIYDGDFDMNLVKDTVYTIWEMVHPFDLVVILISGWP